MNPVIIEVFAVFSVLLVSIKAPKYVGAIALLGAVFVGNLLYGSGNIPVSGTSLVNGRTTMKAAVFSPGATHDCEVKEAIPIPRFHLSSQVFVEVTAAGLNPSNFKLIPKAIPVVRHLMEYFVVGYDFVGIVKSVGTNSACSNFQVGDKIYGLATGSMAEYATAMCSMVGHAPTTLSDLQIAGLPVAALTSLEAWQRGNLKPGKKVLVIGASGGTGIFGVTIGKVMGGHVTGICSTRNKEFVGSLSPAPDRLVDYTVKAEMDALIAEGQQFDIIYDTVTSFDPKDPNYEPSMRPLLVEGGQYIAINGMTADWVRGVVDGVVVAPLSGRRGLVQRKDYDLFLLNANTELINFLTSYFNKGLLKDAPLDSTFDLDQDSLYQAFDRMKGRRSVGKIVIKIR